MHGVFFHVYYRKCELAFPTNVTQQDGDGKMNEEELLEKWVAEVRKIGPVIRGFVSPFKRKCGKKGCRKCASGEGHPSWQLTFYLNGKHSSRHIGDSQLAKVKSAIENGKRLAQLSVEFGLEYLKFLKNK